MVKFYMYNMQSGYKELELANLYTWYIKLKIFSVHNLLQNETCAMKLNQG